MAKPEKIFEVFLDDVNNPWSFKLTKIVITTREPEKIHKWAYWAAHLMHKEVESIKEVA